MITAIVLEVTWQGTSQRTCITNIVLFPWDDLWEIKKQVKQAMPKGCQVLSMHKCKKEIENPLLK